MNEKLEEVGEFLEEWANCLFILLGAITVIALIYWAAASAVNYTELEKKATVYCLQEGYSDHMIIEGDQLYCLDDSRIMFYGEIE